MGHLPGGLSVKSAVENAIVLEHLAHMASETLRLDAKVKPMQRVLLDKHFFRKHGPGAYYGQKGVRQTKSGEVK